ncbi:hypothetical protein [Haladaptatus halobius]|uniref:hypothetical protein n=1 Tax=Haladaptatus halobius TaxID=2884875 RepID=UPI001D0A26FF|nr:hypothetical protein [Haladaptatus halobius]
MASDSRPDSNSSATDDLREVGTDGDEKRIRSDEMDATYVATRVEDAESEAVRKIPEQVVRVTPLRNLLASFEDGIRRMRLDGRESASLGLERRVIEYEGTTYRIEEA